MELPSRVAEDGREHRRARILIVDDEEANVRILERMLRQAGYSNLRGVNDARQVVPLLEGFRPDLILLDLLMPHMDGITVLQEVRSRIPNGADLPILVLTADITTQAKRRSLSAGADDFLTKPFDQTEVLLRIGNLLAVHFLHLELLDQNAALEATVRERTKELRDTIDDLRRVDEKRRRLVSRLVEAQEDERQRIAADIHDDPIQKMTAVGIRLQALRRLVSDPGGAEALDKLEETVRQAIGRMRHLLFELRPPALDREGLVVAITKYLEGIPEAGFGFHLENLLVAEPALETRVIAYRIAQEALANVWKHARAGHVDVLLENREDGLHVRIRDDGVGLSPDGDGDAQAGHLGFTAMRERAELAGGWWRIESQPGTGTTVEFWLPDPSPAAMGR